MPGDSVSLSYRLFGEDVSASSALKGVATEAGKTGKKIGEGMEEGAGHLERLGEGADSSEQRIMGLRDSVDGLTTIMQGPGEQGISAYLQGWADLASGVSNFVVPALLKLIPNVIKNAAATLWSSTVQMAAGAASKVWAAAQWLLNAALSANPIGLIILAIVAFIGIIVLAYNKVGWFRDLVNAAWSGIKTAISAVVEWFQNTAWPVIRTVIGLVVAYCKLLWTVFSSVTGWIIGRGVALVGWFKGLPGRISSAVTGLWDGIKSSFKAAVNWIINAWNDLQLRIGGQHVDLPFGRSFDIPSITLDTPNIPTLAAGGIVQRRPGGVAAIIGEGRYDEAVVPLDGRRLGGDTHIHLHNPTFIGSDKQRVGKYLKEALAAAAGGGRVTAPGF